MLLLVEFDVLQIEVLIVTYKISLVYFNLRLLVLGVIDIRKGRSLVH